MHLTLNLEVEFDATAYNNLQTKPLLSSLIIMLLYPKINLLGLSLVTQLLNVNILSSKYLYRYMMM